MGFPSFFCFGGILAVALFILSWNEGVMLLYEEVLSSFFVFSFGQKREHSIRLPAPLALTEPPIEFLLKKLIPPSALLSKVGSLPAFFFFFHF